MPKRICTKCNIEKDYSEYHKHKGCKDGVNTVCKECRKPLSQAQYNKSSVEYRLWYAARGRSLKKGLEFNIEVSDIVIPAQCPVFGTPFSRNTEFAASVDRIDPDKGYIKGNIQVMSRRANMLKNDATAEELRLVADFISKIPNDFKSPLTLLGSNKFRGLK